MRRILLLITSLLLFVSIKPVAAQNHGGDFAPGSHVRFEHLTIDDGLSQNAGLAFLQDQQGYLWFGTQDGLDRYDGYKIVEYKNDPENKNSLSSNSIISLFQDKEGLIWIGTWGGGLNSYDPIKNEFTRYTPDPNDDKKISDPIVADVYRDEDGFVWVGTLGGLDRLDPSSGEILHYRNSPSDQKSLSSSVVSVIVPAGDGKLWVGTGAFNVAGAGLNLFDPATGQSVRMEKSGDCLASPNISDVITVNDGSIWISYGGYGVSGGGLDHFNPKTKKCTHYASGDNSSTQLTDSNITDLLIDQNGALWATSWFGGLWRLSSNGQFVNIKHDPADPESLSTNSAFSIYEDRSGVVWIGTLGAGINKLNLDTIQFNTYRNTPSNPLSLPNDHVGSFAQTNDGSVWVGIWEYGLTRFNPQLGTFIQYRNDPADPDSISSNLVSSLYGDIDGTLWIGTLGNGLDNYDPKSRKFSHYRNIAGDPNSLLDDQVVSLYIDQNDRLWVGSVSGLSMLDSKSQIFINYPTSAPPVSFTSVGDELWVGTWGGGILRLDLSKPSNFNPASAEFTTLINDPDDLNSLSSNGVWSIIQSPDGIVWLGTEGGLNRYDVGKNQFKAYTTKDGLRNATIVGMLMDRQNKLWLLTNNGLAKFDPKTEKFRIFDKSDGLQSNEYNSNAYMQDRNGIFYVGGVGGFSKFNPLTIAQDINPPDVAITNFSIFNKPQPFDPSGSTPIKLAYNQNFISFDFSAFDFQSPKNNQYSYKLEGFDKEWSEPGTRNYANYTNLPGGDYVFRVRAANSKGVWNNEGVSFKLKVIPPIWQTWQFISGFILLIGLLIFAALKWRFQSIRKQNAQLQKVVEEQKRVEKELRESEARFKAIFDNSAVGMGLMTTDRIVIDSNPAMCEMLGYSREELIGHSPAMVTYPEDFDASTEKFMRLISGEDSHYITERRYVKKNGEVFWMQISMSVVPDAQGKPLYLVGLLNDIDAQKRSSERLAAQEIEYRQMLEQRITERTEELNNANELLRTKAAQDAVIAERTRLARDLHDAVTQTLFSTTLIADVLPDIWEMNPDEGRRRLEEIRHLTRGALAEMRTLLVELRPNALVEVPLPTLLRQLTEALIGRSQMNIQLNTEGERKLPAEVQVGLYRLAQEALNNVVKHAKASQAVVTLRLGESVRLTIEDNGVGFDPSTITADHLGLKIMRERSEAINATLKIYSEPGEGTQVSVIWP
jgi:PAS domain S-box-containing protein